MSSNVPAKFVIGLPLELMNIQLFIMFVSIMLQCQKPCRCCNVLVKFLKNHRILKSHSKNMDITTALLPLIPNNLFYNNCNSPLNGRLSQ